MTLGSAWRLLRTSAENWINDRATELAAALSFYMIFAMAPMVTLLVAIMGFVLGERAARGELESRIAELVGPEGATVVQTIIANAGRRGGGGVASTVISTAILIVGATGREDRGIAFWDGIGGDSHVIIDGNLIAAGDDGIGVFDTIGGNQNQAVRGNATLVIADNLIGSAAQRVGTASPNDGNGIDFQSVTGAAHVVISGNSIYADANGIEFDRVVNTTYAGPGAGVEIIGNPVIDSKDENGIAFEGGVSGASVLIEGNGVHGQGQNGIRFGALSNALVRILDNASIRGRLDGILFDGSIANGSLVKVLDNDSIVGDQDDGIDVNQSLGGTSVVRINGNHDIVGGSSNGIEFADVNGGATVEITGNNDGITADDNGIQFGAVSGGAVIDIHDNIIRANQDNGDYGSGIAFLGTVTDAIVSIGDGGLDGDASNIISVLANTQTGDNDAIDGIRFHDAVGSGALITIDGNRIGFTADPLTVAEIPDDGIEFAGSVGGDAVVRITDNRIEAAGTGVEFAGEVGDSADVLIGGFGEGNAIRGDLDGVAFLDRVTGTSQVRISWNEIRGDDDVGVLFEGDTDNVGHGVADIAITNNTIVGGYNGIRFDGLVQGVGHDVLIVDNTQIEGETGDGIHFEEGVSVASVRIIGNDSIVGDDDGIEFNNLVDYGAFVLIAGNDRIVGETDDGIAFNGIWDEDTDVVIAGNGSILGGNNGVHFAPWPYGSFDLLSLSGETWAIDGAEVTIASNTLIDGDAGNGIWVEGVRGSGLGLDSDNPNLAIVGNDTIRGGDNGVLISQAVTVDVLLDWGLIGLALSGWAVENAEVLIGWNDEIRGRQEDGIQIQGIHTAASGGCGCDSLGAETEVRIVGNDRIVGADNGIHLDRGYDLLAFVAGDDLSGLLSVLVAGDLSGLAALDLSGLVLAGELTGIAIDRAEVEIGSNRIIAGAHGNGVLVRGVMGEGTGGAWNLDIHDNAWILGVQNGILLDRAYGLLGELDASGFYALLEGWAIFDANVRIADNGTIFGDEGDGIQVNGVSAGVTPGISVSRAGAPGDDAGAPAEGTVITDPAQPDLLIARNTTIVGGRDGIHFGNGFSLDTGDVTLDSVTTLGSLPDLDFVYGYSASVDGALVVIDGNGEATYQADPDAAGPAQIGDLYDPAVPVVLSDLGFGGGISGLRGQVTGLGDDGIDFAGAIRSGAVAQVQRNMIVGSGDNGIEFSRIGSPSGSLPGDIDFGPANVFVHNNFILDNGQRLPSGDAPSADLSGPLTGAGILFEQGVGGGSIAEVFQNYIAGNGGPGLQVGFSGLTSLTAAEAAFFSEYGYEYDGPDGPVSASGLRVVHNYLPGAVDSFGNRPNGSYAIANYATDGSFLLAPENWFGTTALAAVDAANEGNVFYLPYLATGEDSNQERAPGLTGLSPFAFQPGDIFIPADGGAVLDQLAFLAQALLVYISGQTNPEQAPGDRIAGRTGPDSTNTADNPFANPYGYLDPNSSLADLAPAAGDAGCTLTPVEGGFRLSCAGGPGGVAGLAGLAPAAGGQQGGPAGPALDPGLSLQELLNMWLFNFGTPLDTQPVADLGTTGQQATLTVPGDQLAMR